jgi:hypothetical protein
MNQPPVPKPKKISLKKANTAQADAPNDEALLKQKPPSPEDMAEPEQEDGEDSEPEPEEQFDEDDYADDDDEDDVDLDDEAEGLQEFFSMEHVPHKIADPLRRRKVVELTLGEDTGDEMPAFVLELGARRLFKIIGQIKNIITRWVDSRKDASDDTATNVQRIFTVIAESEEDIFDIIEHCLFTDKKCTQSFEMDDLSIAELAMVLRTVWYVNWEIGGLKKNLAGVLKT